MFVGFHSVWIKLSVFPDIHLVKSSMLFNTPEIKAILEFLNKFFNLYIKNSNLVDLIEYLSR